VRQLRILGRSGWLIRDGVQRFPEGRRAATLAIAKDAFAGGADVGFEAGVVNLFESLAGAADEGKEAELLFHFADGGKIDFPEIEILAEKGYAVSVAAGLFADVADDADFGFLVFFGPAEDELLLRGKLVAGEQGGAVKAKEDRGGGFGEHAAVQIAADEEDGDFFRDAGRAAHGEEWASEKPEEGREGDNLVPREKEVES
jgi:hypothetical protein